MPALAIRSCLIAALALSACVSTRPVVKIGLLAPFEGLHRESGYEALSAMRAALADFPVSGVELLPLALDTSADPAHARRAVEKMLRDPSVAAIIGPLQQAEVAAVAEAIAATNVAWRLPTAFKSEESEHALVAALIRQIEGRHILLAGLDAGWPHETGEEWSEQTGKIVTIDEKGIAYDGLEGVLWMGAAAEGAAFLAHLRLQGHNFPFWTTSVGGDRVFFLRAMEQLNGSWLGPVYWAVPIDESFGTVQYGDWIATHVPSTPTAYAVYLSTARALQRIAGQGSLAGGKELAVFTLDGEGISELALFVALP